MLKQDIQDNKPLMDKLNKTGLALIKLSLKPKDLELVQSTMDDDNKRIEELKRAVRERSMSIDEALQQSAEVTCLCYNINGIYLSVKKILVPFFCLSKFRILWLHFAFILMRHTMIFFCTAHILKSANFVKALKMTIVVEWPVSQSVTFM